VVVDEAPLYGARPLTLELDLPLGFANLPKTPRVWMLSLQLLPLPPSLKLLEVYSCIKDENKR